MFLHQSEPPAEAAMGTSLAPPDDGTEPESLSSTADDRDSVPASLSAPDHSASSSEFVVVNTEGKASLSRTAERESVRSSLPTTEELQTLPGEKISLALHQLLKVHERR